MKKLPSRLPLLAVLALAGYAHAIPITVQLRTQVDDVQDPSNVLAFALAPGDILAGTYTYDTDTPDTNPAAWVGDYWHTGPAYGLSLRGGGLRFASDPLNSSFLVEIVDGYPSSGEDDYTMHSYNNLSLPGGAVVEIVSWSLYDFSGTVFGSTALPTVPLDLSAFQQQFFGIMGHDPSLPNGTFGVYAHVVWVSAPSGAKVDLSGFVQEVSDPQGLLGGQVQVGDTLAASYVYDTLVKDLSPLPTVGSYRSVQAPFGIKGNVGSLEFASDPTNVAFLLQLLNDHEVWPPDRYELRSNNNLPLPGGLVLDGIAWRLQDPSGQALTSTALPSGPPELADWQSPDGFTLLGHLPGQAGLFVIRAQVTSAQFGLAAGASR